MWGLLASIPAVVLLCVLTVATCQELLADWHQMERRERRWSAFLAGWAAVSAVLLVIAGAYL